MAQPLVMGDKIQGQCAIHQVPNPATGAPQPSPAPLPFSAPLLQGLEAGQRRAENAGRVESSVVEELLEIHAAILPGVARAGSRRPAPSRVQLLTYRCRYTMRPRVRS